MKVVKPSLVPLIGLIFTGVFLNKYYHQPDLWGPDNPFVVFLIIFVLQLVFLIIYYVKNRNDFRG